MEVLRAASRFWTRQAVLVGGSDYRYQALAEGASQIAYSLRSLVQKEAAGQLDGPRVAIMAPPGRHFVESLWGTWLFGGIAVPLCLSHPPRELQYVLETAQVSTVLASEQFLQTLSPLAATAGCKLQNLQELPSCTAGSVQQNLQSAANSFSDSKGAIMLFTSGTTGRPKGVVHTHRSVAAMIHALTTAWEWRPEDRILHALPLHHMHGLTNALLCPHAVGASVDFLPNFSPSEVWAALQREQDPITVFMGVPTMYTYLLNAYDRMRAEEQAAAQAAARRLRLTVCGSSACPLPVMERWKKLSGQVLLERYGMTETGMVLSNPLRGERRPGFVGLPLPGMRVWAAAVPGGGPGPGPADPEEEGSAGAAGGEGELLVAGEAVFREYWNRPDATAEAFDEDGFFRTGDTVKQEGDPPYWRILGRTSVDIIKSGGYKISALAIEDVLLEHPSVTECAVVGLPDASLGEVVSAVIALHSDSQDVSVQDLQTFVRERLPPYQIPRKVVFVDSIPRNAMGKVNKKQLCQEMFPEQ